jgi:hypothetical protein
VTGKDYGHWDISLVGKFNPNDHLGFVYQITHKQSGKSYIGCKHLWKFKKRKRVKASEWRYYRPVSSYDSDFRCVMSDMATGTGNGRYRGSFYITYDNGIEVLIEDKTVSEWCLENGYNKHGLYRLRKGNQKVYQNIIAMEYASERD